MDNYYKIDKSYKMDNIYIPRHPTRKKQIEYVFGSQSKKNNYRTDIKKKPVRYYYQVCIHRNIYDNMYHVRRYTITHDNIVMHKDTKNFRLNDEQYKQFFKDKTPQEHKLYSTYTLDNINPPHDGEFLTAGSELFETDERYVDGWGPSGFGSFHKY